VTSTLADPSKLRYFDKKQMAEVYLERHNDTLYARVQKVTKEPPPDWETPSQGGHSNINTKKKASQPPPIVPLAKPDPTAAAILQPSTK